MYYFLYRKRMMKNSMFIMRPIQNSKLLFISMFVMIAGISHNLSAAEEKGRVPAKAYNKQATDTLQAVLQSFGKKNDHQYNDHYRLKRGEIRDLILNKNANPELLDSFGNTIVGIAGCNGDEDMLGVCLKRGANPNGTAHVKRTIVKRQSGEVEEELAYKPLYCARKPAIAQLLIRNGAKIPQDIVRSAINLKFSADMLAFFGNAGVDPNASEFELFVSRGYRSGNPILSDLFDSGTQKDLVKKTAILMWFNAEHKSIPWSRGDVKKFPRAQEYAAWIKQLDMLREAVPATKNPKIENLFKPHIKERPARIVRKYMQPLHLPWNDSCFAEIEFRMKQIEVVRKLAEGNTDQCSSCSVS